MTQLAGSNLNEDTEELRSPRKKKRRHHETPNSHLHNLADVILENVLVYITPEADTVNMIPSCSRLAAAGRAETLWKRYCDILWKGKLVPRRYINMKTSGKSIDAYWKSLEDSRRSMISQAEVLGLRWSFRFKEVAGPQWQEQDPWWLGHAATKARFREDGCIKFSGQLFHGRPPRLTWRFGRLRKPWLEALRRRHERLLAKYKAGEISIDTSIDASSEEDFEMPTIPLEASPIQYVESGDDSPRRKASSSYGERAIRAKVMGRDVPTYCIRREPSNWGWVMESCWVVWTSWPMPLRGSSDFPTLSDTLLPVSVHLQQGEAMSYNEGDELEELGFVAAVEERTGASDDLLGESDWLPGVEDTETEADNGQTDEPPGAPAAPEENDGFVFLRVGRHVFRLQQAAFNRMNMTRAQVEDMVQLYLSVNGQINE